MIQVTVNRDFYGQFGLLGNSVGDPRVTLTGDWGHRALND